MKRSGNALWALVVLAVFGALLLPGCGFGLPCGGAGDAPCAEGQFCKQVTRICAGADAVGVCTDMPDVCTLVSSPVCGCDDVTYGNPCLADDAGVSVAHFGACGEACGGMAGDTCLDGQFCKLETGSCEAADGVCTDIPDVCIEILQPVCGCNGTTYSNECIAEVAGVSIDHDGECITGSDPG